MSCRLATNINYHDFNRDWNAGISIFGQRNNFLQYSKMYCYFVDRFSQLCE